ncbi:MAG: hypothetical protein GEU78_03080 [Actinobacteria bacterium]|nr:hypothetical protein [Actinomycetota bacterium]
MRPHGVLIDIHPQPEDPRVEIVGRDGSISVGRVDWTVDSRVIRDARKRLAAVQREGLFRLERRRMFEFRMYHDSVDAWLEYRRDRDTTSVIPARLLRAARREMRAEGSRLVVVERARASALRRMNAPS